MIEKRKSARRRTLLDGRIEVAKLTGWGVTCAVRNVSDAGARLALPGRTMVPDTFQLGISGAAPQMARLVWYRDGQAGVALDAPGARAPRWDGTCRRAPHAIRTTPAESSPLRARIDAIATRRGPWGRSFTRP